MRSGNLEAAGAHARACALDGHVIALAAGLAQILSADGPYARALDLHRAAADAAQSCGDLPAHAAALTDLGIVWRLTADLPGADSALTQALAIHRATGDRNGEAQALVELGRLRHLSGDLPGADAALTCALDVYWETGHRNGEAYALTELGTVRHLSGDLPGADNALTLALKIYRAIGHHAGEGQTLVELGRVRNMIGDLPGADAALTQALDIYRETGHRNNEAWALNPYAAVVAAGGDLPRALALSAGAGHEPRTEQTRRRGDLPRRPRRMPPLRGPDPNRPGPPESGNGDLPGAGHGLDAERVRTRLDELAMA